MNSRFLRILFSALLFTSCSTAYKSGQTPDDVYYSPVRTIEENNDNSKEEVKQESGEDRQMRMATYDRRWRNLDDDYDCHYDPYHYGYNYGYYYNPYYCSAPVYTPGAIFRNPKNSSPRMANLGGYNNSINVLVNPKTGSTRWEQSQRPYNNSNNHSSFIRKIITPASGNTSHSSGTNDTRTYTPSSHQNSSSSGGSTKTVTRPGRN